MSAGHYRHTVYAHTYQGGCSMFPSNEGSETRTVTQKRVKVGPQHLDNENIISAIVRSCQYLVNSSGVRMDICLAVRFTWCTTQRKRQHEAVEIWSTSSW